MKLKHIKKITELGKLPPETQKVMLCTITLYCLDKKLFTISQIDEMKNTAEEQLKKVHANGTKSRLAKK